MSNEALKSDILKHEADIRRIRAKLYDSVANTGKHSDRSLLLQREIDGLERRIQAAVVRSSG